jgi:chromatin remodeling complex protein RSC6
MTELKLAYTEIKGLKIMINKIVTKNIKHRQNKKGNQQPHGFAVPSSVSEELCIFMKKEPGSPIARTEVTKALTTYIKEHSLQDPLKKRDILPDETLLKLFGKTKSELSTPMTFFNMQKYINHHFIAKERTGDKIGDKTGSVV